MRTPCRGAHTTASLSGEQFLMTLTQGSNCMFIPGCSYQSEAVSVHPTIPCAPPSFLSFFFFLVNPIIAPYLEPAWNGASSVFCCFFPCLLLITPQRKWEQSSLSELSLTGTDSFVTITINVIITIITPSSCPQPPQYHSQPSRFRLRVSAPCSSIFAEHLRRGQPIGPGMT